VIAARSPGDSFYAAVEAVKIATRYMVPVMLLSDGYIANGSEPWPIPDVSKLARFDVVHRTEPEGYFVYQRNAETLAREWVVPGTPGLEHRIGGIEKDVLTGNISYEPINHERQTKMRADKVERIAQDIGELDLRGDSSGDVLVIGWGGTFGALRQAVDEMRSQGRRVSHAHLRWLSPLEPGLEKIIHNFKQVIVAELNSGQLRTILRARFVFDIKGLNKVQGLPFKVREVVAAVEALCETPAGKPAPALSGAASPEAQA
jgi:2-oxoglutarate ferredoxin oxidoreductase subunit alpha